MEVNRKTYAEDSTNTIRMQRQQIDKLKKDNERLKEDLALETRQAKQANNQSASAQIAKLQDQADMYARKIDQERRRIEQLDTQIKKMEEQVLKQRKDMGGVNASQESSQHVQKEIKRLENRLDKALVKFNEALAHNKHLRETIDNLRRERVVFDGIYKKLERELNEKKQKMAEIIEISNAAYEARDKAQAEMIALKAQADEEQTKFESDWSQLGQLIEKDRRMRDFMKQKEREKGDNRGEDSALEEEQKLRKRVSKGAWGIAKDKANIHLSQEKVQSYEEAFAKIQKATKITDIDLLVQTFISAEDQNFSLFNYVNDKSNEIERLEDQIAAIKVEIKKYKGTGNTGDDKRKKIIADLETKLGTTGSKADKFEDKYATASKTIEALKKGIQSVYDKIGFNDEKVNEILGNSGVTESNMMQYLGVIEQRVNELLQIYVMTKDGSGDNNAGGDADDSAGAGDNGGDGITANAPSGGNYSDGDSEEDGEQGQYKEASQDQ